MVRNRSLAEFNLTKQPELEEGKREIQALSEEGNHLCTSVQEKLDVISKLLLLYLLINSNKNIF